ncbi:diguanylate cyclase [Lachnotalea glycerini]|nr:diguanylate cyclase [Lachnotalea glycerini]
MEEYYKEIENEYKKIDLKWLNLHYKTSVGVVIFAFFVECVIGILMYYTDEISTTIPIYLVKFLIVPCVFNLFCIIINNQVLQSKLIKQESKIYITSLTYVLICFVLFTAHNTFTALYFIFALPILLTTIYGNYRLTTITAVSSMLALAVSELFTKWDVDKESIWGDGIRMGNFLISIFVLIAFSAVCMVVIHFEREKNVASMQKEMERYKLQKKLQIDELTGIYNRIGFRNAIRDMEEDDSDNTYIFVMIDIDNFKILNDTLGHVTGDHCLIKFGEILKNNGEGAIPFRYGGDEFGILFKNYILEDVVGVCKKIQRDFASIRIDKREGLPLTVSIGIAKYSNSMAPSALIINTDKALYESKIVKNTITIFKES